MPLLPSMLIRVDMVLLKQGRSRNGSWSKRQLEILGVEWPLEKGWRRRLLSTSVPKVSVKRFLELKDAHLKPKDCNPPQGPAPRRQWCITCGNPARKDRSYCRPCSHAARAIAKRKTARLHYHAKHRRRSKAIVH